MIPRKFACSALAFTLLTVLSAALVGSVTAGDREQAKRIHDRLAGVPPSDAVLTAMQADIAAGDTNAAAYKAMDNPEFYRVTLKNFITPWTNEALTVFEPLNDYTATLIGIVRDDYDFRRILYDDILYTGPGSPSVTALTTSNAHYKSLEDTGADLQAVLAETTQSSASGIAAPAGIFTTRAAAKAFFSDGTNRAMFRFTMLNHLCNDMEQVKDTSYVPDRIRQDVSRSPGGDSRLFLNGCVGCHTGMDPMAQAFAYYDYEYPLDGNGDPDYDAGQLVYNNVGDIDIGKDGNPTGSRVQEKFHINANNFEFGFVTPNDNWDNYWRTGSNSSLGWDTNGSGLPSGGSGASSMGRELANSEAFARCQVEKVFQSVCLRSPVDATDRGQIDTMISTFKATGYKLKQVFADSAVFCRGS
ncbi:MAG: hypothetical protein COB30_011410 [Ectothiorhodospiraceae bacterium]|nr:hypothetical protein [Ectothiorhodospiraceae bacterium]